MVAKIRMLIFFDKKTLSDYKQLEEKYKEKDTLFPENFNSFVRQSVNRTIRALLKDLK